MNNLGGQRSCDGRYQYSKFATLTTIRLLTISRSPKNPSYSLDDVDLNDNPVSEALSYTRRGYDIPKEDTELYASICIDGSGSLEITHNLATILRDLHVLWTESQPSKRIWIDQISINQNDLNERSQQVSLMHRVYSQAEQTLLWVGKCDEHSPVFLDLIRRLDDLPLDGDGDLQDRVSSQIIKRLLAIFSQTGRFSSARLAIKLFAKKNATRDLDLASQKRNISIP